MPTTRRRAFRPAVCARRQSTPRPTAPWPPPVSMDPPRTLSVSLFRGGVSGLSDLCPNRLPGYPFHLFSFPSGGLWAMARTWWTLCTPRMWRPATWLPASTSDREPTTRPPGRYTTWAPTRPSPTPPSSVIDGALRARDARARARACVCVCVRLCVRVCVHGADSLGVRGRAFDGGRMTTSFTRRTGYVASRGLYLLCL